VSAPIDAAARILGSLATRDAPLGALTTYRVGGPAALSCTVESMADLALVGRAVTETGIAVLVLGRGSNLLVADTGFGGLAVVLGSFASEIHVDGRQVRAGGAVLLPVLARQTVAAGLSGLEWMVGVPGSVGGAVRMNAGGHGSDVQASLVEVRRFDLCTGEDAVVPAATLALRFRGSDLLDHQVVVEGTFSLAHGDRAKGETLMGEIVHWRREHQPGGQNAGSVFVNPDPGRVAAGQLIDDLGLRGMRIGSAEVSTKHANFIQADPAGRADDVYAVMRAVRDRVLEQRGIALRTEIRLVGYPPLGDGAP